MEAGFFAPVIFEQLAKLDTWTGDGRRIESAGFGTRNLPRPIYAMFKQSEGGHIGAVLAGRLDEVTINADGVVSGKGLLLDDEVGRKTAQYLSTKVLTGNSIDLADVEVDLVERKLDDGTDSYGVTFTRANIGATTIVGVPAFADATASLGEFASGNHGELVVAFSDTALAVQSGYKPEMFTTDVDLDWFVGKEAKRAYPLTVEGDGRVHGYLTDWETRHLTNAGHMKAPRGRGYEYFNASTVLTPKGPAHTGPLVIGGDHAPSNASWTEARDFYASTSYAWADVHVTDDRHGIRLNGMVRPGTPEEAVHAGRASRLSGDWRRVKGHMELVASLSCNAPAFPVGRKFASANGLDESLIMFAPESFAGGAEDELLALRNRVLLNRARLLASQEGQS